MVAEWPGYTSAYNCITKTQIAVSAYIIERVQAPLEKKVELSDRVRQMRRDLQCALIEGGRAGMQEAAQKWAGFELHKIFMNTLDKRMKNAVIENVVKEQNRRRVKRC